jgi:iron complex transport system ATP-binding protein
MVLHDLNQAARYADTIVAMRGGQIVAHGAPDEVMTPENILQVFGLEADVATDPVTGTPMCIPIGRRGRRRHNPAANGAAPQADAVPIAYAVAKQP